MNKLKFYRVFLVMVLGLLLIETGFSQESKIEKEDLIFKEVPIVITAAKKEQPVYEAPSVITIITGEDIKRMGAKNLMDVLQTVPGFNIIQDTNELLTVIHGFYASTNQKFLLLKDGNRLNDYMFNTTEFDYSLSLANVKRIEIVRGPGSALYGSAAMCGVVNVITKDGSDINGSRVNIGAGNYGQLTADIIYGKDTGEDSNTMLYGSFYSSKGEKVNQPKTKDISASPIDGWQYVDKYPYCYDIGLKLNEGNFTLSANFRRSEYSPPRANNGGLYNRDNSAKDIQQVFIMGDLNLMYKKPVSEDAVLKINHFLNYEYYDCWQLFAPERDYPPYGKLWWIDFTSVGIGGDYSFSRPLLKGDILTGLKIEKWGVLNSSLIHNVNDPDVLAESAEPLLSRDEGEYYIAGYVHVCQKLHRKVRLNLGASYDYYELAEESFNPRVSLVTNPAGEFYWKLLYAKAFMDPTYFYRYITPSAYGYYGGEDLKPEKMTTFQTSLSNKFGKRVYIKLHVFYNNLEDLITQIKVTETYENVGEQTMWGIEPELKLNLNKKIDIFANYTFQEPVEDKTKDSLMKDRTINDIPAHTANSGINYMPVNALNLNFLMNWHGKIESPGNLDPEYEISPTAIFNFNIIWKPVMMKNTEVSVKVNNIFDKENYMGGNPPIPFPQKGRWFLVTVGCEF